jgi:hypothetical protein
MKKRHVGKIKAKFLISSILKKIDKDNLKNKHVGKYCSKTKTMWGKHCNNSQCFKEKIYEAKFSTNSI